MNNNTDDFSKYEKHEKQRKQRAHRCLLGVVGSCAFIIFVTFVARRSNEQRRSQHRQQALLRKFYRKQQKQQLQLKGIEIESSSSSEDSEPSDRSQKDDEILTKLSKELDQLNQDILSNTAGGIRWIQAHLLPNLPGDPPNPLLLKQRDRTQKYKQVKVKGESPFVAKRRHSKFEWEKEYDKLSQEQKNHPTPKVDYTKHQYDYPDLPHSPPSMGGYPKLQTLGDILSHWPQDELDDPPKTIKETLFHFNYSDPTERGIALKFRDAELPFKMYDIPEVTAAGIKWTDDYVASHFDASFTSSILDDMPLSDGQCQESPNNYFAFYTPQVWNINDMGLPPVRNNDMTFQKWSQHARYADAISLSPEKPHFYWQAGVPKEERFQPKSKWTFISRDLPSFSSPGETFFQFHISEQKGIQCRFGERGVTAATHYDGGKNMIAMLTGAKRYVLSPPRECSKLGITTNRGNAIFRHSLLNFGHLQYLDSEEGDDMSPQERAWLERARDSEAVDTVLKAGEVLYLPSHWFHYIISLQKSAQCNVRSGIDQVGTREFGGIEEVKTCGYDE